MLIGGRDKITVCLENIWYNKTVRKQNNQGETERKATDRKYYKYTLHTRVWKLNLVKKYKRYSKTFKPLKITI